MSQRFQELSTEVAQLRGKVPSFILFSDVISFKTDFLIFISNASGLLSNFSPATPIFATVEGHAVQEARFRFHVPDKAVTYAELFNARVSVCGYKAKIHRGNLMVYKEGVAENYQCPASHENVLRAYKAFRWNCADNVDEFMRLTRAGLTEAVVQVLPLSPDESAARYAN